MSSWRRILGSARLNPIALRNSSAWAEFLLVSRQEDKEASEAPRLTNVSNGRVRIIDAQMSSDAQASEKP